MACSSVFKKRTLLHVFKTPADPLRTYYGIGARSRRPKIAKKSISNVVQIKRRGEFLYGVAPCLAAMQANRRKIHHIYIKPGVSEKKGASKRSALSEVWRFAEKKKVEVLRVDKNTLESLSGKKPHQGVVLDVAPLNYKSMDLADCKISHAQREQYPLWLVLDEIQDPMNLGAILRCAYFLGVDRVVTSTKRCCPLSPAVSKASSGAMELMPVYAVSNLEGFLNEASSFHGWTVLGTTSPNSVAPPREQREERFVQEMDKENIPVVDCSQYITDGPTIIALGNEGYGLHSGIKRTCSALLTVTPSRQLPQGFDSLNVAVAAGILLHTLQTNKPHSTYK